jgi:hypothetical protein
MESREHFCERFKALEQQTAPWQQPTEGLARGQMPRRTRGLCGLLAMGLVVGWLTSAAGQAISCGDTLGPGGRFILQADLACRGVSPALTVRDGAQLDLGGHTISVAGAMDVALLLDGQGAVVHNGIVEGREEEAIHVAGDGGHTVRRVSVFALIEHTVVVTSDRNRLINNAITTAAGGAIAITGNQNLLHSNWAAGGQIGFSISGDENRLVENTHTESRTGSFIVGNRNLLIRNNVARISESGFAIRGDGNTLLGNLALDNGIGIEVSGQESVMVRNTALDNRTDLVDTHENCDANRWQQNVFRTSRAGATENPACIQ